MGDYHIHMLFNIDADPDRVRGLLDNTDGISSWWSNTVGGTASAVSDEFTVAFPDAPYPFEFEVKSAGPDVYDWYVDSRPEWWTGTTVRFEVGSGEEGGTALMFSQRDFEEGHPIVPIVTPAWAMIVNNLKAVAEGNSDHAFFVL